jgi:hypothetical protein
MASVISATVRFRFHRARVSSMTNEHGLLIRQTFNCAWAEWIRVYFEGSAPRNFWLQLTELKRNPWNLRIVAAA